MILEYGNMIRRIVDTEYRQVCEYTSAQRGRLKSAQARPGAIEMGGGEVPPPPLHLAEREAPQAMPPAGRKFSNYSKQSSLRAQAPPR